MTLKRLLIILYLALAWQIAPAQDKDRETFIRDFTRERLVTWPNDARKKDVFKVIIINDSALYKGLNASLSKKALFKKNRISVVYAADFPTPKSIYNGIIYLHKDNGVQMREAVELFKGKPVLIVGENFPFNQSMINMVWADGKFSFEYNRELIEAQGLGLTDELVKQGARTEVQWKKLLSESEKLLAAEQARVAQKNRQIHITRNNLNQARQTIGEQEQEIQTKDIQLDIANLKLDLKRREVELEKRENAIKNAKIAGQNRFITIMIIAIVMSVVALFFIYRSYAISRKVNAKLNDLNKSLKQHKDEIFEQKLIVEAKKNEITDSINYALRIQRSMFPPMTSLATQLPESFIVLKPKDIVSGDFYWFENVAPQQVLFTVVDCTGHGVPGALMSVVGINHIRKIVRDNKTHSPDRVLTQLDDAVTQSLREHQEDSHDGMDMALCLLNKQNNTISFSGANNPMWIVSKNTGNKSLAPYLQQKGNVKAGAYTLIEIPAEKKSIASKYKDNLYALHTLNLQKGDTVYIFSDGYADQFGGSSAKKFKKDRFKKLLLEIQAKSMNDQKSAIIAEFESWKGNFEQIDDVCVMGVRI